MALVKKNRFLNLNRTNKLGELLRKKREKMNFSLADVRDRTTITRAHLCNIENGHKSLNDLRTMVLLATLYDIKPTTLFKKYMEDKTYERF